VVMKPSFKSVDPQPQTEIFKLNFTWNSILPTSLCPSVSSIRVTIDTSSVKEQQGQVITLAGGGIGFWEGGKSQAKFTHPWRVAVNNYGDIFISDYGNHRIRKITNNGVVNTFVGGGISGYRDDVGTNAMLNGPAGIAFDSEDNMFLVEFTNHKIRKITKDGTVSTIAGSTPGLVNGKGTDAKFRHPCGIAFDATNNIFITDCSNHCIRKITPHGFVSTFVGNPTAGYTNAIGTSAQFNCPEGIAFDKAGNMYVADAGNNRIRKVSPQGVVGVVAGGISGYLDSIGTQAQFNWPSSIIMDTHGNFMVTDSGNAKIRKVTPLGVVTTVAGSVAGNTNGECSKASFNYPRGIAFDSGGGMIVVDWHNHNIRRIT